MINGEPVYMVKRLLAIQKKGRGRQYQVYWEGYGPEERDPGLWTLDLEVQPCAAFDSLLVHCLNFVSSVTLIKPYVLETFAWKFIALYKTKTELKDVDRLKT